MQSFEAFFIYLNFISIPHQPYSHYSPYQEALTNTTTSALFPFTSWRNPHSITPPITRQPRTSRMRKSSFKLLLITNNTQPRSLSRSHMEIYLYADEMDDKGEPELKVKS